MFYKLALLFNEKEQRNASIIFLFVVIGAGLEVISLASLAAFIGLFFDEGLEAYSWIIENAQFIWGEEKNKIEIIQLVGLVVGGLFLFKNIYLLFINYIMHRFIYNKYTQISVQLLKKYIEMPYVNHLKTNSAFLQRNVNTEVFWLFANILIPGITLLTELVIVLVIMVALLYVEPLNTLILIGGFGFILLSIMTVIKKKMDALGLVSQSYFGEMVKAVDQSLGGVKLTKVSGTSQYFVDNYRSNIMQYSNNTANLKNIAQWPRYFVEVILVFGIVISAIVMTYGDSELTINLSTLSFFGMAAIRLMPSFNRITSAYTNIRYYSASLDVVFDELNNINEIQQQSDVNEQQSNEITFNSSIEFKNINFSYPETTNKAIANLSFKINKGQSIALIGKSGSGKTTIVDLICGLLSQDDGEILADDKNISDNLIEWRKLISYVPQHIYLLDDSLRNNIAYGKKEEEIDDELIQHVAALSMLDSYINGLELGYNTIIGEDGVKMSGGQRQRLGIARALYSQPELLILDEGTAALDNKSQEYIVNSINSIAKNITVITIAHRLSTVENSDLIFLIENGKMSKEISSDMLSKFDGNLSDFLDNLD